MFISLMYSASYILFREGKDQQRDPYTKKNGNLLQPLGLRLTGKEPLIFQKG